MSNDYDNTGEGALNLAQYNEAFAAAPLEDRDFEDIPDDNYQVRVEKVEIGKAKTGNPMLGWTLKILGPKFIGRLLWHNNYWVSDTKEKEATLMSMLKKDLCMCGVNISLMEELPARLVDLLDVTLEVKKETKGKNVNVIFKGRIVMDDINCEDEALAAF